MAININSEASCRKAYLDYHGDNKMNISAEEMGRITQAWSNRLSSWQATVANDENEYDFDDSEYAKFKNQSSKDMENKTGYKDQQVDDGLAASGHMTGAMVGAGITAFNVVKNQIAKKAAKKAGEEATKQTGKETAKKSTGIVVANTLALATGTAYMAKKPNKEEKNAAEQMLAQMSIEQGNLTATQDEMATTGEYVMELSDNANAYNEDANETLEDQKTEYDDYMETYLALKEKIDAGETLTESEQELYNQVIEDLLESGVTLEELMEETTDSVSEIYEEMDAQQESYDAAAEQIATTDGVTAYANSFDETAEMMCKVEALAQGINVASGGAAATRAFAAANTPATWWYYGIGAMGLAGAGMSTAAAAEQLKWASEIGIEIDARKTTQDFNTETNDIYTDEIDNFEAQMEGVEDLELEVPEDMEEGIEKVAEAQESESGQATKPEEKTGKDAVPDALKPENNKKKKEDEE